ncbi:hypothetical protein A3I34_01080 [Candidatus Jorgensenbacteria bacterium RIFCSPLOWO2_02_FULL_45_12]|uniref:Uncharacterized protein n=2 Tax=Candidatus Joergenseniibacteriota TaxID=1752739 RepID=A0A1F6BN67_9BACT|nr:MAG: hypothetical protein UX22_C0022G0013 [Candidatus Jorgensenbacteria bacterium GW2011_GWA2_45_9]OGG38360.1 MAG: hypothetical protein A3D55_00325 [Candidatus Jorgensenbacteria bacterium RIFCSPHIGHO2_02_FULL_45_20]OGG42639.1 MAG: hypothetical protein A3I34_01080 [Candidatus Jorgensenbacteria bacterium RIFCSPLOWO2_02_FULL_45_12]
MVGKLKSFLRNPIPWRSLYKSAFGTAVMLAVGVAGFPWFLCLIGISVFFWLYAGILDKKSVRGLFWVLVLLYAVGISLFDFTLPFLPAGILWFSYTVSFFVLFTWIMGLGNFLFENRDMAYDIFHTVLSFIVFLVFGSLTLYGSLWWGIALFAITAIVFGEYLNFHRIPFRVKNAAVSVSAGFFSLELLVILSFLPIGPISTAAFLALFTLILRDVVVLYFSGTVTKRTVLREIMLFLAVSLAILAVSRWTISG